MSEREKPPPLAALVLIFCGNPSALLRPSLGGHQLVIPELFISCLQTHWAASRVRGGWRSIRTYRDPSRGAALPLRGHENLTEAESQPLLPGMAWMLQRQAAVSR